MSNGRELGSHRREEPGIEVEWIMSAGQRQLLRIDGSFYSCEASVTTTVDRFLFIFLSLIRFGASLVEKSSRSSP